MKTIQLKRVSMKMADGTPRDFDYRLQLLGIAANPADNTRGAGIDEIRKSIRIIDALEKVEGQSEVQLEDADYEMLVSKVNSTKFVSISKEVLDFVNTIVEDPKN